MGRPFSILFILIIISILAMTGLTKPAVALSGEEPQISGEAGILLDADTGQVLWGKNPHQKMFPASTTKIMTAILVLELGDLDGTTVTSRNARNQVGSSLYLEEGEEILIRDLLYGVMLRSANDGSVALAEYIAGSVEEFAWLMNQRARELGALNTNFVNPNGLHDDNHYTTAYDLAVISRHALTLPEFREIVGTTSTTIPWPTEAWDRRLDNGNRLLTRYPGANGIKTGYTQRARGAFVGSALRDDLELIAVTLGTEQVFEDAVTILDFGFDNFEKRLILSRDQNIILAPVRFGDKVPVKNIGEVNYTTLKDSSLDIVISPSLDDLEAPLDAEYLVGQVEITINGQLFQTLPLVTTLEVKRKITTYWWFYGTILLALYIPLRLGIFLRRRRKKRRFVNRRRYYHEQQF